MWKEITTRWIRLQRKAAVDTQAAPEVTESLSETDFFAREASGGWSAKVGGQPDQTEQAKIAALVLAAWQTFFISFRDDEREIEFQHYQAAGLVVNDRLKQFGIEKGLDEQTVRLMLVLLKQFIEDRFLDVDERINLLMATNQQLRARLDGTELTKCYQEDELNSCQKLVRKAMGHHRVQPHQSDALQPTSAELRLLLQALVSEEKHRALFDSTPRTPLDALTTSVVEKLAEENAPVDKRRLNS